MTSSDTDYSINNKIITRFIKCSVEKKVQVALLLKYFSFYLL